MVLLKRTAFLIICVFIIGFGSNHLRADSLDSARFKGGITIYLEFFGHNYYGYRETIKATPSINLGYQTDFKFPFNLMLSGGWGFFREQHVTQIPFQPQRSYETMIRYIPLEADFLIGRKVHRFEIGMSYVWAWGAHDVRFEGSHGSEYVMHLYRGYQTIVRIGYSCFCHNGLYFRASIAEHFISNVLNPPNPYSLQRNVWIPFGLSVGYSFS